MFSLFNLVTSQYRYHANCVARRIREFQLITWINSVTGFRKFRLIRKFTVQTERKP